MKFGLLFGMRNPELWRKPYQQVYEETLEQVQLAETLGFDSVWMSEHHSADDGYCPSTLVMAGAAAVKTCLLYTSPSPRDLSTSRMPSSA